MKKHLAPLILIIFLVSAITPVLGDIYGPYAHQDYGSEKFPFVGLGRKLIVAHDLIWAFGVQSGNSFGYWTSPQSSPSTFSSFQSIRSISEDGEGVSVDTNGTHIAYAVIEDGYDKVLYRLGVLNADGSISWSAVEQTVKSGGENSLAYPAIVFDGNDQVWIGYCQSPWVTGTSVITTTTTMDGTWNEAAGYPEWGNGGDYHEWHTAMAATQDANGNVIIFSLQTTDDHDGLLNWLIAHNGTTTDNDAFLMPSDQWEEAVDIVGDPDTANSAYMAYVDRGNDLYAMTFERWLPGAAGEDQQWTTPELIEENLKSGSRDQVPTLSIDAEGAGFLIYLKDLTHINYATSAADDDSWSSWLPFGIDTINAYYMQSVTSARYAWNSRVWFIKGRQSVPPYTPPYSYSMWYIDASDYSIANVTSMDADTFDWGNSWGDSAFWYTDYPWVFEGKRRYSFTIEYENASLGTVTQTGIRFTDELEHTHTIWYDKAASTLTVTSPDDAISGWIESFTQVNSTMTATFELMFNKPIPDSYAVQLEMRVIATGDTGWLTPTGGLFNIYNLGGLATLYDEGTAGRISGGDIFEIYAADTRTRNVIPVEGFDVRYVPLRQEGWQEWVSEDQQTPSRAEQDLLDELTDSIIFMDARSQNHTMFPTNGYSSRLSASGRTYNSYPFGLRIYDNPRSLSRLMFLEKEFFRKISASDNELVTVQVYAMVPTTKNTTGRIAISENGYYPYHAEGGTINPDRAANLIFAGNGSIRAADGGSWITIGSYTGETWYNITFLLDMNPKTYSVYIDGNLNASGLGFQDAANVASLGYVSLLQNLYAPVGNYTDIYFDDVWAHTNFTADYGGVAEATMLFDKNQHWSMDYDFFVENGQVYAQGPSATPFIAVDDYSDHGYVELGWDIMINKTMVHDFIIARVNISNGQISGKNDWVQFNVTWYANGTYVKNDVLYGLFEGYSLFPGSSKDTCGFHWDIWFNRANASTVVGARINTEYYGMSDKAKWWAIWSSKWTPMRSEVSESTLFINLRDNPGTIHPANDVSFVRSWVKLLRNSQAEFSYKVLNIAGLDFLIATDTMSGIDTPPIRETLVPDVLSGFFGSALGAIFMAALKRLGNTLAGFGMGFFTLSIDFIDNVFGALGYPALVSTIFGWMDSLFANVPTLLGYGLTMIDQIFSLVTISAGNTLTQLTSIITIWVGMYSTVMDMLNGVLTPGLNLWNDLGINSFIRIGAVLYPLWLLMMASDKGGQAVLDHLTGVLNIGSFFLNFILNVTGFFVSLLTGLIGAIRG